MTRTSPLAPGSAEFGSQDPPCGQNSAMVLRQWSRSVDGDVAHLISPAFCGLQSFPCMGESSHYLLCKKDLEN